MKGDKLTVSVSIFAVLLSGFIYYVSICTPVDNTTLAPWPFNEIGSDSVYAKWIEVKEKWAFYVFLGVIIMHLILYIRTEKSNKKWLNAFLKHVVMSDLGGKEYNTRITIFRKKIGYMYIFPYIIHSLRYKRWWSKILDFPNPFKYYLVPYLRWDFPKGVNPAVYFKISNNDEIADSVVGECYRKGRPIFVKTKYMEDVDLPRDEKMITSSQLKEAIDDYKEKTNMPYNKIRLLKRRANQFFACVIPQTSEKDNELWGVIVFDRYKNDAGSLNDQLSKVEIDNYIKIVQFSLYIIS